MTWAGGIDVGGTHLKAVAVTPEGSVLGRHTSVTRDSAAECVEATRAVLSDFTRELGHRPDTVGVCAPGLAAADGRSIAHLPVKLPGVAGLHWTDALAQPRPVPVLNDAHAALLGEAWIGAAQGCREVVMLTLGTGVGGAVMSGGRLLRGAIGRAGHIGHMSLDPNGPRSITGMPGALEMMIGDCSIGERTHGRFQTTAELVAAHRSGNADATRIWLQSVRALACAVASCINLFDPELVVLGGGIAGSGDALFTPLARELDQVEWRPAGYGVEIVPATLGPWAGAIGAARNSFSP